MTPHLITLDHFVLTVTDIDTAVSFYSDVLGMTNAPFTNADGSTRHAMRLGALKINLHQRGAEFEPKAQNVQTGSADLCFLTQTPLSDWQNHCAEHAVAIEMGPVARTGAIGPILSLYLRDPDGNLIEISTKI